MRRDSVVAQAFFPSAGRVRQKYKERPKGSYYGIVIHTTGGGLIRRFHRDAKKKGWQTIFDTALFAYTKLMVNGPHYVVWGDRCVQVCEERYAAWHVGKKKSGRYRLGQERWLSSKLEWWARRWPGEESPLDLCGGLLWDGGSCNNNTIGIEVPPWPDARAPWSMETWRTLSDLIVGIASRRNIPLTREHIISHSDAHPLARTTSKGAPWDPWESQWSWEKFAAMVGLPMECDVAALCPDYEPPHG